MTFRDLTRKQLAEVLAPEHDDLAETLADLLQLGVDQGVITEARAAEVAVRLHHLFGFHPRIAPGNLPS